LQKNGGFPGELKSVEAMLGEKFIAHSMTKHVVVVNFVFQVYGVHQKRLQIMLNRFGELSTTVPHQNEI